MKFSNPYWSEKERIDLLERWILVHSIIYYELNESLVSDKRFDLNSKQLMEYRNGKAFKKSRYYDVFKDFDGCTGFDLFGRLIPTQQHKFLEEAQGLIKMFKE